MRSPSEIHAVTGLDPVLRGDMSVSLFPSGTVTFHNVVLGETTPANRPRRRRTDRAACAISRCLAGRIEIADVTLVRPTITVSFLPGRAIELVGH